MRRRWTVPTLRTGLSTLLVPLLSLLLILAAVLLYRGIHQLSEGDFQREKKALLSTSERLQGNFSQQLREVVVSFRPLMRMTPAEMEAYLAQLSLYSEGASPMPGLVKAVGLATLGPGQDHCRQFDFAEMNFKPATWPPGLLRLREVLDRRSKAAGPLPLPPPPLRPHFEFTDSQVFCFLPVQRTRGFSRPDRTQRLLRRLRSRSPMGLDRGVFRRLALANNRSARDQPAHLPVRWVYLELDFAWIRNQLIPGLIQRHFGDPEESPYQLAVMAKGKHLIYPQHSDTILDQLSHADHLRPLTLSLAGPDRSPLQFRGRPPDSSSRQRVGAAPPELGLRTAQLGSDWTLVARHKSGSLQQEVAARKKRNLVIGFTILFLIGTSAFVVVAAGQRAARLAHLRMEFVAGVTHELRTPLAVIDSAGANLSRGLVLGSDRLEVYGSTIQKESRRLAALVDQILEFAGLEAGRSQLAPEPLDPVELVEQTLAEFEERFRNAGWVIEREFKGGVPPVWASAKSLGVALRNLLDNTMKYAAGGRWVRIAVKAGRRGSEEEVQISVQDRGPGIPRQELRRIFDPFYRGGKYLASSTPGSGLGLSLVQRHLKLQGGRVTVESEVGRGAIFTLHLPALSAGAAGV